MRINLRLWHKGLIFVAVLLGVELMFVGALAAMLNQAEQTARQESHSKEIVGITNHLFQLFYDAGTAAADYQMHDGGKPAALLYHATIEKIPDKVQALKQLVQDNPGYLDLVDRVDENVKVSTRLVSSAMDLAESGHKLEALVNAQRAKPEFSRRQNAFFADLRALMNEQEKFLSTTPLAQERWRQKQKNLLWIGLFLNIVLAVVGFLLFIRGLTRRLDLVVDNTERLLKRTPLNPPLAGSDEIASLDQAFHRMAEALKQVELMKQEFVAMVSHDLRVPLTTLKVFLELLSEGGYGPLSDLGQQRSQLAARNVTRLITLINELLDMEKMESGQLELNMGLIPLDPVVAQSLDMVRDFASERQVTLTAEPIDLDVYADGSRVQQVLVNMLTNAIKYSPAQGTVSVSATQVRNLIEVKVMDQGPGIAAKYHEAVFERFRQIPELDSENKGGSGLGLAICKAIIEQHGGSIGVESEEGQGSCFWFRLPAKR